MIPLKTSPIPFLRASIINYNIFPSLINDTENSAILPGVYGTFITVKVL